MDIYGNEVYNINCTLKTMADTLQGILGVLKKPENRFKKVLQYVVLFVGALGILSTIELVRRWIIGG